MMRNMLLSKCMIKKFKDLDLQFNLRAKRKDVHHRDLDQKVIIEDAEIGKKLN
jgi:hypothetical protein